MISTKKKKIIIFMSSMFIGGAETSLLGLLDSFDYDKYDVDLFLLRHEGELIKYIPEKVNILPEKWQYTTFDCPVSSMFFSKKLPFATARVISKISKKLFCLFHHDEDNVWKDMQYTARYLNPLLPKIEGKYDLAISFNGYPWFLLNKVNADKKMIWIHIDYNSLKPNRRFDRKLYAGVDKIVNVSDDCAKVFEETYPEFKSKSVAIENIMPVSYLNAGKNDDVSSEMPDDGSVKILSIGRFSHQKNFENIPPKVRYMLDRGINVKWYIIGYPDAEYIIKEIEKYKVEDNVIILGKKNYPYSYINACDIYCQPSRYEGKSVAVREAQMLGKPVVITDYVTASSQLESGVDGIIAPMDNDGCAQAIIDLIKDKELMNSIIENILKRDYSNKQEIQKIYEMIG